MSTPKEKIPTEGKDLSPEAGLEGISSPVSDPQPTPEPEPVVDPFAGTRVAGMSVEQGAEYIKLLEATTQEQKDRLTRAESQPSSAPITPPPPTKEEAKVDFFENPHAAIEAAMAKAVAPLNDQIAEFRTQGIVDAAWTAIAQEIPDFAQFRPMVEQLITSNAVPAGTITVDLLRHLYYTAVGFADRRGGTVPTPTPAPAGSTPTHIPQHRPSAAPLSVAEEGKPKLRELTENERVLAKFHGQTDEEYLRLQDEDLQLEGFKKEESNV